MITASDYSLACIQGTKLKWVRDQPIQSFSCGEVFSSAGAQTVNLPIDGPRCARSPWPRFARFCPLLTGDRTYS